MLQVVDLVCGAYRSTTILLSYIKRFYVSTLKTIYQFISTLISFSKFYLFLLFLSVYLSVSNLQGHETNNLQRTEVLS